MTFPRTALCLSALMIVAGCKGDKKGGDVLAQDSTLTRDLQLANRDTTAQPQLKDVPSQAAPSAPAPQHVPAPRPVHRHAPAPTPTPPPVAAAPAPAPVTTPSGNTVQQNSGTGNSEGHVGTISAGTSLALVAGQRICTNTSSVGDRFTATLSAPVATSNGAAIPAGATVVLEVTSVKASQQAGDNMQIGVVARSLAYGGKTYPINGEITSAQVDKVRGANNNDAAKVLGGAAIGAVIGNIFGGRSKAKGTIIGAAGGAAAGAIAAHQTAKYDACIPSGGRITVRLDQDMQVQTISSTGNI